MCVQALWWVGPLDPLPRTTTDIWCSCVAVWGVGPLAPPMGPQQIFGVAVLLCGGLGPWLHRWDHNRCCSAHRTRGRWTPRPDNRLSKPTSFPIPVNTPRHEAISGRIDVYLAANQVCQKDQSAAEITIAAAAAAENGSRVACGAAAVVSESLQGAAKGFSH